MFPFGGFCPTCCVTCFVECSQREWSRPPKSISLEWEVVTLNDFGTVTFEVPLIGCGFLSFVQFGFCDRLLRVFNFGIYKQTFNSFVEIIVRHLLELIIGVD